MGLFRRADRRAAEKGKKKDRAAAVTVALAGNPNVGKSTLFNALTGMHQHTGNWTGKTVSLAVGQARVGDQALRLVDLPGTYSLLSHSAEEEVARDFLCFGGAEVSVVVCDATCLARNLNLVLQVLEITPRCVVCVNLLDEAKRKGICPDLPLLADRLGVPVVGTVARKKRSLNGLLAAALRVAEQAPRGALQIAYPTEIEAALAEVGAALAGIDCKGISPRFVALKLLEGDPAMQSALSTHLGVELDGLPALAAAKERLTAAGIDAEGLRDRIVEAISHTASGLAAATVTVGESPAVWRERRIDRLLTGRYTAYPFMLLLLALIFFLTVVGANYPSEWLATGLSWVGEALRRGLVLLSLPPPVIGFLVDGVWLVLSSVVAVMLPPMAIFFPLFTILEDVGYLPRIAYNLDRPFARCRACGKQALTMCMGFGCNAVGVTGCRIIDSPRERLLAMLTNAFVPCNGRFPTLIAVIGIFFVGGAAGGLFGSLAAALLLSLTVLFGILLSFLATRLLSATLLSGAPSSFVLELPPYRPPQVGKILVRSVLDRTLYVLGRAAAVAAPAGAVIYLLANLTVGGSSLLTHAAAFLDPVGRLMGLDGAILLGFLLGIPANEIVLPLILMIYTAGKSLPAVGGFDEVGALLSAHGWSGVTALCFLLFMLLHWPCSTTLLTVKRESGSWGYTAVAFLLPTLFGVLCCLCVNGIATLFQMG